jgi:uncharacterized protein YjbJ (UPF0337 family)
MKESTKDELIGIAHVAKGSVKKALGQMSNDAKLKTEGQVEQLAGKVQRKLGQGETVLEK